jgi:ribosomal protein S18 acetylase RimI-like enzyme
VTPAGPVIRRYRDPDHDAVYDICVRTADAGGDARGHYSTDDLMGDLFAGPYLCLEPDFAFVLDTRHDGEHRAVGYVVGTPDTAAYVRSCRERWIPQLAARYPVPPEPPLTPEDEMLALGYQPELMLWPGLAEYPAHLHIDLLPAFQGQGHGRQLMETFYAAAAAAGATGVYVAVMTSNLLAQGFYRRLGFTHLEDLGDVVCLGRKL